MPATQEAQANHQNHIARDIAEVSMLGSGAAAAGVVGERLQTEAEGMVAFQQQFETAVGANTHHSSGIADILASSPDLKALALSLSVLVAFRAASLAERMRRGAEAPDQPAAMRFIKRTGALAVVGVGGWLAYRAGVTMTPAEATLTGLGVTGASVAYMAATQAHSNNQAKQQTR